MPATLTGSLKNPYCPHAAIVKAMEARR